MPKAGRLVAWLAAATAFALIAQFGFFFYRDNFSTHYPLKVLSAKGFRAGEIPYWNFHDSGGQALAGNPGAQTFYPDNVLYLLLPPHTAFNLHFLLHLAAAFFAMRALCRSSLAATIYVLSGVVISSTAFYNFIVYAALIPFALYAAERRSWRLLGIACGLMGLAAEPVLIFGAAVAILIVGRMPLRELALALLLALLIASPQLIAYSEISGEVERVAGFSTRTALNTSLNATRVAELFFWPLTGVLNEPGGGVARERLFSTIFLGPIALIALVWCALPARLRAGARQRRAPHRYTVLAALMLFLALGRNNPVVYWLVDHAPRAGRYPEKFVLVLVVALVVLIARYLESTRYRVAWAVITLVPLIITAGRALPIDWFAPYDIHGSAPALRVHAKSTIPSGVMPARVEYRKRAAAKEPLFGAVTDVRYALVPSPDNMHSLMTRAALELAKDRALEIQLLPPVLAVPVALGARDLREAVRIVKDPRFDPRAFAVAPQRFHGFRSARVRNLRYQEHGQTIYIRVDADGPVMLLVNQTYFSAWNTKLATFPVDIDRLGVLVPAGTKLVTLHFGRQRIAVAAAWIASVVLLLAVLAIEIRDRRAGEVERPGHDDRALG
ncbi:MAG TPA: hypothetical protein VKB93_18450 [Thermoanaerobaculia bacterium]|nr:hypothetical protein [Thermoanaerobaculia bacterium]